ncbi:MAG: HPr-rel-A system PqqD family peptide chaperone [Ruminococcaceae bacterium]|nr:HPr-rel-A system PqqD family peptide chaperone [Oscillospiraceae bacterium]
MNSYSVERILPLLLKSKGEAEIGVIGKSMNPLLFKGDKVMLAAAEEYEAGDVLVFRYKNGELLIHRLLFVQDGRYFCKGDNSFRLEDLSKEQIFGKVIRVNGKAFCPWPAWKIRLSYAVNRAFFASRYDVKKTKQTNIYKIYQNLILKKEVLTMIYRQNKQMDIIPTDENTVAVFDPDSGDTHFLDETATDILKSLESPCDFETLLARLCEIYDASPEDIRADVEEFLADMAIKKVVEVQ